MKNRSKSSTPVNRVVITDIQIPFWHVVLLLIKWALACIPAAIILAMLAGLFAEAVHRLM